MHTPTLTATKWWPGDMGLFSTHAIVYANLITEGKSHGVLPFLVRLRSDETFMPERGVKLGDMGPKMGMPSKNNSYAQFDQVRIPRENMCAKFVSVDRNGTFRQKGDMRSLYATMTQIRMEIAIGSGLDLLKGCLIGLRYSVVRRQFRNTDGSKLETKLLDYQT